MYKRVLFIGRLAALGLIAFPEPVTTVIGVAILAGTCFVSKKSYSNMLKRFERRLSDHLNQMRKFEYEMSVNQRKQRMVQHHTFDIEAFSKQYKPRKSERPEYHSLRTYLFEQYRTESSSQTSRESPLIQCSVRHNEALFPDKAMCRSLDIQQILRRYQAEEFSHTVSQQKIVHPQQWKEFIPRDSII